MSNWKTKNSALDLYRRSPPRLICTLLTASYSCALSLYPRSPTTTTPTTTSCVFTSLSLASIPSEAAESQLTLALSQLSQINVFVPHKSMPACRLCSPVGKQKWRFFFAVAPTAAPLPHNARGRAERLQIRSYVLHGTALDIKQEGAGLKRRHVEQICRDQWVMFVIFRNTMRNAKWGASRGSNVFMVMFNWLEGLLVSMLLFYLHMEVHWTT